MNASELMEFDRQLSTGGVQFSRETALDYAYSLAWHPERERMTRISAFSMLAVETLLMCRAFALESRSGIIEIGAYIGGSTAALALGVIGSEHKQRPFVSIDFGGSYAHPSLPSEDIHADWGRNLAAEGLSDISKLVAGWGVSPEVVKQVRNIMGNSKSDLLFIDANGDIEGHINLYSDMLKDNCLLIFDDY